VGIAGDMSNILQGGTVTAPAPPPPEPEGEVGSDPSTATVQQVKDYVTAHPEERDRVLAEEQAGQARVTLIDWLSAFTP
jgi:hypothetical protein